MTSDLLIGKQKGEAYRPMLATLQILVCRGFRQAGGGEKAFEVRRATDVLCMAMRVPTDRNRKKESEDAAQG